MSLVLDRGKLAQLRCRDLQHVVAIFQRLIFVCESKQETDGIHARPHTSVSRGSEWFTLLFLWKQHLILTLSTYKYPVSLPNSSSRVCMREFISGPSVRLNLFVRRGRHPSTCRRQQDSQSCSKRRTLSVAESIITIKNIPGEIPGY